MTVKVRTVDAQIRSLEEELKVLKTLTGYPPKVEKEKKTFSSLKGIWKNKSHFTMKEIKETEVKV